MVHPMLNREVIRLHGTDFNVNTSSADTVMWHAAYSKGYREPNYPVPAIPLLVMYPQNIIDGCDCEGYADMVYIDDISRGADDPVMVCCWDFYLPGCSPEWVGKYCPTYIDARVEWYKKHGAWDAPPSKNT